MIRHLIKLMWNKRGANGLLFLEILLAFVVLFGVYAFAFYNLERFMSPLGFNTDESVGVSLDLPDDLDSLAALDLQQRIKREILELPNVEAATFLGGANPFTNSTWGMGGDENGFNVHQWVLFADEDYATTLGINVIDGRWFVPDDDLGKYDPIVVTELWVDTYFPDAPTMVDSLIYIGDEQRKIVGVIDHYKYHSNFAEAYPLAFFNQRGFFSGDPFELMIVRATPGQSAAIEEPIYNTLVELTKNSDVVIWNMAKDRAKANRPVMIPLVIMAVISGFLLINIALGLFGVLFTQINRRRAEIGLRKAMGATASQVTWHFVLEVLLVTSAALLVGLLFAIQIPILDLLPIPDKYFYFGALATVLTIVTIVVICSIVPSRGAAGLHPAMVLHEE